MAEVIDFNEKKKQVEEGIHEVFPSPLIEGDPDSMPEPTPEAKAKFEEKLKMKKAETTQQRIVTAVAVGEINSIHSAMLKEKIQKSGGYCPCKLQINEDNKCLCKEFRDKMEKLKQYAQAEKDPAFNFAVTCSCGLFAAQAIKAPYNSLPPEVRAQIDAEELNITRQTGKTREQREAEAVAKAKDAVKDEKTGLFLPDSAG